MDRDGAEISIRSRATGYAIAVAAFAMTFIVREGLGEWLRSDVGLVSFIPAVLLVTYFVGLGPGILTGAASIAAVWYFFIPCYNSFKVALSDRLTLAMLLCGIAVSIIVVHGLRFTPSRKKRLGRLAPLTRVKLFVGANGHGS